MVSDHPMTETGPKLVKVPACWVCGGTQMKRWWEEACDMTWQVDPVLLSYDKMKFGLARCEGCGFIQPEELPHETDFFDRLYSKDRGEEYSRSEAASTDRDFVFQTVLAGLGARVTGESRKLLDVGTADGRMMVAAIKAGWETSGIELNPAKAKFAAERTGRPVHSLNAKQFAATGELFDAIALSDVLEHIPEPMHVLKDLRKILRPGGWIAVKVPQGVNQWRKQHLRSFVSGQPATICQTFTHVNHFQPKTLKLALENAGFKNVTVTAGAPELFSRLGAVSRGFRRLTYALAKLPGGTATPLTLNLQAYAQNPV
jgi:2-polyprenyl-3-methyl-5-hydroxy-6-metoxy-1,4-benzoquinol methylase